MKMRVGLFVPVDGPPSSVHYDPRKLLETVRGLIPGCEVVEHVDSAFRTSAWVDEEGRLRSLLPNLRASLATRAPVVGNVVFTGSDAGLAKLLRSIC